MRPCTIAAGRRRADARPSRHRRGARGTGLATASTAVRCGASTLALVLAARLAHAAPGVVVRAGDLSPLGLPFSRLSGPALDDRGQVAFVGGSTVLFTLREAGIAHVAGAGETLLGRQAAGVGPPALGPNGCLGFRSSFVGGGAGVFTRCGDALRLVADVGLPLPGGGRLAGLGEDLALGSDGRVAFTAVLDDGTTAILVADGGGTLTEVVRTGTPSPAGGTFTGLKLVGMSGTGRVGFRAVTSRGPDGLFYWDGSALLRALVVVGDASFDGGSFTSLGFASMNEGDVWAFRGTISSGPRSGVFRARTSGLQPSIAAVALDGDTTPIGGAFRDFPSSLVPAINRSDAIAFRATVQDGLFPSGVFVALPDGTRMKVAAVGEPSAAGQLVRLREVAIADDGGVVFRASLAGGTPGLFRARAGRVDALALLGDATDLGGGFRFTDAAVRDSVEAPVFLGAREGLFVVGASGDVRTAAALGERTPLKGRYAGFDPPAAGGGRIVFGASIQGGGVGEALFAVRRGTPVALAKTGDKVRGCGNAIDLFSSGIDDLARAGVGPRAVAFQTALGGGGATSGIALWNGDGLRRVACAQRRAPGGGRFQDFGSPAVGGGARVAFVAIAREASETLFRAAAGRMRAIAVGGGSTDTRLRGIFRGFEAPAAAGRSVAFHALLDQGREGVFIARGRCTMALAGTGEPEPGGRRFRTFGPPVFAGPGVVFRATVLEASTAIGLYRAQPSPTCTQVPPPIELLVAAGAQSPIGVPFLGFGPPTGNRRGTVAFTADLTGAGPTDAIVLVNQ